MLVYFNMLVTCPSHKEEGLILSMEGGKREVCSLFKGDLTMLEGKYGGRSNFLNNMQGVAIPMMVKFFCFSRVRKFYVGDMFKEVVSLKGRK